MLHIQKLLLHALIAFTLPLLSAFAQANPVIPVTTQTIQPAVTPAMPAIDAKSYILIDATTGKVLAEKSADLRVAPASLTKLMSLYLVSAALKNGSIHLDDKVHISTKAWKTGGSRMFIKVNDDIPVQELMQGIIVASGNDATVAMAEHIAGSEEAFTSIMNDQAKALGMNNSHFTDSTGLPNPEHYSTARDFAILAQAITQTFPEDYRLFSEKWFTHNGIRQPNRNRLLWRYQYADGLKTGHTDEAGYCLVGSANKNGMRLISVVMGAANDNARTEDSIRLLTYGFRFYETRKLYSANAPIVQAHAWKGVNKQISLGLAHDFYATLPTVQAKNIQTSMALPERITAPITKGKTYGTLRIMLNGEILASQPLIALADDPKGGFFSNIKDSLSYSFHKMFSKSTEKANNG